MYNEGTVIAAIGHCSSSRKIGRGNIASGNTLLPVYQQLKEGDIRINLHLPISSAFNLTDTTI